MANELGWTSDGMKQAASKVEEFPASASTGVSAPGAPNQLDITKAAISQLQASSDTLKGMLDAGDVESKRMASALRAAADAFDKVVSQSKEAFDKQMHSDRARPSHDVETVVPSAVDMLAAPTIVDVPYPAAGEWDFFNDWRTVAKAIHSGDTAASELKRFRDDWNTYKDWLPTHAKDFVAPDGKGTAAEAYTQAMQRLGSWWSDMGAECERLAQQADKLIAAHEKLVGDHPTMEDVKTFDDTNWLILAPGARALQYGYFQTRSERAMSEYANGASLQEIRPGKPPSIRGVPSTNPGGPAGVNPPQGGGGPTSGGGGGGGGTPEMPEMPSMDTPSMSPASADPSAGQGSGGSPSGGSPSGGSPSSGGGAPSGGMPSGGLPKGTEGMPEVPGLGEPSLKPASAGGGGGGMGGGGGGMPAGPLGPAVGADSVAASPAAARGGGAPAGAPGGAGAGGMGGGMGGMGGGHGQGQGKEKRRNPNLSEDEDLYVEDRAYTEAVIGRRARKDAKDGK